MTSFAQVQADPVVDALRDELDIAKAANRELHRENKRLRERLVDLDKRTYAAAEALGAAGAEAYWEAQKRTEKEAANG